MNATFEERIQQAVLAADGPRAALRAALGVAEADVATAGGLLYTVDPGGRLRALAGGLQAAFATEIPWFEDDPCLERARRIPGALVHATRAVAWRDFAASMAFREFYDRHGLHHVVCLRLCAGMPMTPGSLGVFLARAPAAGDFSDEHKAALRALVPTLSALSQDERRERRLRSLLAGLAGAGDGLGRLFVFSTAGALVWATDLAHELVRGLGVAARAALERAAREAAAELALPGRARAARRVDLGGEALALELTSMATDGDDPLLLGRLVAVAEPEARVAARYGLTPAEAAVLGCLGEGMANRAIADELGMAVATVATHVKRILAKMAVASRLQAGLVIQRARLLDG